MVADSFLPFRGRPYRRSYDRRWAADSHDAPSTCRPAQACHPDHRFPRRPPRSSRRRLPRATRISGRPRDSSSGPPGPGVRSRPAPSSSARWHRGTPLPESQSRNSRTRDRSGKPSGEALTLTSKVATALKPLESRAVTVIVATPRARAETTTEAPDVDAAATPALDEAAVNDRLSPSGSVKYVDASSVTVSPVAMDWLGIVPTGSGVRFGTVTSKLCWAVVPVNVPGRHCHRRLAVQHPRDRHHGAREDDHGDPRIGGLRYADDPGPPDRSRPGSRRLPAAVSGSPSRGQDPWNS